MEKTVNRQNQVRRTIAKLKEQVAAERDAAAAANKLGAEVAQLKEQVLVLATEREATKIQRDHAQRDLEAERVNTRDARAVAQEAMAEAKALQVEAKALREALAAALARRDALQAELAKVEPTPKLRRRLQERGDEVVRLSQRVRDLEAALTEKARPGAVEEFNRRHGGTP